MGTIPRRGSAALLALLVAALVVLVDTHPARALPPGFVPGAVTYVRAEAGSGPVIVRVGPDGARTTIDEGLGIPELMALGDDGTLYVLYSTSLGDMRLYAHRADGSYPEIPVPAMSAPASMAVDSADAVYIADQNGGVVKIPAGGPPGVAPFTGLLTPDALAMGGDDTVYLYDSNFGHGQEGGVVSLSPNSTQRTVFSGSLDNGVRMVADLQENLYLALTNRDKVIKIAPDGTPTDLLTGHYDLGGIGRTADGELYVALYGTGRVARVTSGGLPETVIDGLPGVTAMVVRTIPTPPTTVTATPGDGQAEVSWSGATGNGFRPIDFYQVTASPGGRTCTTTSATACTVTGLSNNTAYTFSVIASNTGNDVGGSKPSVASMVVTPVALTVPPAPTGMTAAPADSAAVVSFTPAGNVGSAILRWEISTDGGANWSTLATRAGVGPALDADVPGLVNGTLYTLRVRAVNAVGDGLEATANVTPADVPGPPGSLSAEPADRSAVLTFQEPVDGGATISSYETSIDGGGSWQPFTDSAATGGRTGTVGGLTNGTQALVLLRARNSVGPGPHSDALVTPATTPGAPTAVLTRPGDGRIDIEFEPPTGDGGNTITGYEASTDDGVNWAVLATSPVGQGSTLGGSVGNLANDTTYQVRVRAVNARGGGAASAAVPTLPVPSSPSPSSPSPSSPSPSSPSPSTSPSSPLPSPTPGVPPPWISPTPSQSPSPSESPTPSPSASPSASPAPSVPDSPSPPPTTAVPGPSVPTVPTGVRALAGTSSFTVSWSAPASNGVAVTGYRVAAAPGPATCVTTGATSCVLGGVAGQSYTASVVALSAGGSSASSDPSSSVVPTAPATAGTPPRTDLSLDTDRGPISTTTPGQEVVMIGNGFAAHSTVTITFYSRPTELARIVTDEDGSFRHAVTVPHGLTPGQHAFVATGVDRTGAVRAMRLDVTLRPSPGTLPVTGTAALWLLVGGLAATTAGAALLAATRKIV
ncbi:fibronectin type III domain-containing protein [Paractinoplanes hotanensis]|uniref:Fibronectin type III domain-containing protein n=1 Tax=Paractinoplanes hotanensis TaxID=2906497 RepID=A0ABT0YFG7_9ACTN|nr:fibronectin type III domain-containing protein [Actinoplanes hotanensis]MCM4084796.1 fibronectin type III domain-containing protein [Actinoplanes hotanensis]